jgi:hypothetical protein
VAASPSLCSRLVSLRLGGSFYGQPFLLSPLGHLSALTELSVAGAIDPASAGWLPAGLVRLRLGARWPGNRLDKGNLLAPPCSIGGPAWMGAVAACSASLRSLELVNVRCTDVWLLDTPDAFKQTLNKASARMGRAQTPACLISSAPPLPPPLRRIKAVAAPPRAPLGAARRPHAPRPAP